MYIHFFALFSLEVHLEAVEETHTNYVERKIRIKNIEVIECCYDVNECCLRAIFTKRDSNPQDALSTGTRMLLFQIDSM